MSSENNNQQNENPQGVSGQTEPHVFDEARKDELVEKFKDKIMPIADFSTFKTELSKFVFDEAKHAAIHGVGIGKINGNEDCVRIYFDQRKSDAAGIVRQTILALSDLTENETGIKVQLVDAPQAVLSGPGSGSGLAPGTAVLPFPCNATREYTSLPAGTSIWRKPAAKGTIGYFCKDSRGIRYVLSCNHVLANFAAGNLSTEATLYRDSSGSSIIPLATLSAFVTLDETTDNLVDAALAEIFYSIQTRIIEGVTIKGMAGASIGQVVEKHGIATCGTVGVIDALDCDIRVNGPDGKAYFFKGQIMIVPRDPSKPFAARGDSGALVFERGPDTAVGLLFAAGSKDSLSGGADDQANQTIDYALANPIGTVMSELTTALNNRPGNSGLTLDLIVP